MTALVRKAVFDTNILLSGHFWKGPPYRCLVAAEADLVLLVVSDPITSELREKLTGKFEVPAAEADAIIDRLKSRAEHVPAQGRSGWVTQDPGPLADAGGEKQLLDTALQTMNTPSTR